MSIFHNGKQIHDLYHNGKQIKSLYHNGKKNYQRYLPSGTNMFITPTVVTGSRNYYTNEVIPMDSGSNDGTYNLNMFVNTTIELYHPISQTKNGIIISFKNYMAAVATNTKPPYADWGYNLINSGLNITLSKSVPSGNITGSVTINGEGGGYELGATIVDDTHIRLWTRSESGGDYGTSVADSNYSEFFGIVNSIKVA